LLEVVWPEAAFPELVWLEAAGVAAGLGVLEDAGVFEEADSEVFDSVLALESDLLESDPVFGPASPPEFAFESSDLGLLMLGLLALESLA